jgi:hypothetical protein
MVNIVARILGLDNPPPAKEESKKPKTVNKKRWVKPKPDLKPVETRGEDEPE